MSIESLLDNEGKGVLTDELMRTFIANGCQPACHICSRVLKRGDSIHLKPFFVKTAMNDMLTGGAAQAISGFDLDDTAELPQVDGRGQTTSSIDVMICMACSVANKTLSDSEANKVLALAHLNNMIESAPEKTSDMGIVKRPSTYSSFRQSGHGSRSGGCMIVRRGGSFQIVGAESAKEGNQCLK